ncbi:MAG: YqgE/AlgH family protein [Burkholderiales bacterium]
MKAIALVGLALALLGATTAHAQRVSSNSPMLLIASPRLADPNYRQVVVLVAPIGAGHHIGVIVNRPTPIALAALFPDHEASKKVVEPVFSGGPMGANALLAVIVTDEAPGPGAARLTKRLYLTANAQVIDAVIERAPASARYFVGHILWREGELAAELTQGLWRDAPISDQVVRRNPESLWEELWVRATMLYAALDGAAPAVR